MAILTFWSGSKKETGQTLSLVAIATHMSIEYEYKTLIIDATLDDDTINRCFWKMDINRDLKRELNMGKLDFATGTEGLITAIASNKTTSEIIPNYTKVVHKKLDVLLGLKATVASDHEKSLLLYSDLLTAANKCYDLVLVDLSKTDGRESTRQILKMSDVVMYTMSQNLKQINQYKEIKDNMPELRGKKVVPLLCNVDEFSKYNPKNVAAYVKNKELSHVLHNNTFLEAASEAEVAKFFYSSRLSKSFRDKNSQFVESVAEASKLVVKKFEEIRYGIK